MTIIEIIEWREVINEGLATLTDRECRFLVMRFEHGMTYKEIGIKELITAERVRQVIAKALRKLHHPARVGCYGSGWANRQISEIECFPFTLRGGQ